MGKKKKSGKGKGKGKAKKVKEQQMTFKEAILAYQIGIKERTREDYLYEVKQLNEKHERYNERNERLKQEQLLHIKKLLKDAKEHNKSLANSKNVLKDEVITSMMEKWEAGKREEQNLGEMRNDIKKKEKETGVLSKDVSYWKDYKERGMHEHRKQIDLLEKELADMQDSFNEMSGHLDRALARSKDEIVKYTEETLDKQKFIASEKAMGTLDKHARQEVLDNDWMKKEKEIHTEELIELKKTVENLEKENLEVMSELFECRIEDLKVSRNFYLTQFEDEDTLEDGGILEMDLALVSLKNKEETATKTVAIRPKSATAHFVESKVFSLSPVHEGQEDIDGEEYYDGHGDEDDDDEELDLYENYFTGFADEDYEDYLNLGPLELKLLNLTGIKAPLHERDEPTDEEIAAQECNPEEWPVTTPMIKTAVSPRYKQTAVKM